MNVIPLKNVIDIELWDGSIPNDNICFQACPSDTLTIRTVLLLALDKSLLGDALHFAVVRPTAHGFSVMFLICYCGRIVFLSITR